MAMKMKGVQGERIFFELKSANKSLHMVHYEHVRQLQQEIRFPIHRPSLEKQ